MKTVPMWVSFILLVLTVATGAAESTTAKNRGAESVEERRLRVSMREELERFRAREEELRMREMELKTLAEEVDKKLVQLTRAREELQALLDRRDEEEERRVKELARMYEKMEPLRAAQLLVQLKEDLAVQVLDGMKTKAAGRVLNSMPSELAARLSRAYSSVQ